MWLILHRIKRYLTNPNKFTVGTDLKNRNTSVRPSEVYCIKQLRVSQFDSDCMIFKNCQSEFCYSPYSRIHKDES